MKWRLREGQGEALYEMGVEDNGALKGLSKREMQDSVETLTRMAVELGAATTVIRERRLDNGRLVAEIAVRKIPDDQNNIDVRIAVMGSADAGKSTLLGVLTQGTLDNGRGSARLNMFRHLHEVQTGRTSSISHEILGFSEDGSVINYGSQELMTAEEICINSTKIVTFLDLAGHKKYLRTTISGLSGYYPHYAMLVVSSSSGVVNMTQEHLNILLALEVPFFVVVTKTDVTSAGCAIRGVKQFLRMVGVRRVPLVVNSSDDMISAGASGLSANVVPIFCLSSVTGEGLELLTRFLHLLPPTRPEKEKSRLEEAPAEFHVDEVFHVTEVGRVLGGMLKSGVLCQNARVQVGPLADGSFVPCTVSSVHRNKTPCKVVRAGQSAALRLQMPHDAALAAGDVSLRRGTVVVPADTPDSPRGCLFFQAKVLVLYHTSVIHPGFQTTVYIGSIRQTARIEGIMAADGLNTNQESSVLFRFVSHPEYVRVGNRLLFKEGMTRGIGTITQVFPVTLKPTSFVSSTSPTQHAVDADNGNADLQQQLDKYNSCLLLHGKPAKSPQKSLNNIQRKLLQTNHLHNQNLENFFN